jgi:hypothetical protein
MVTFVTGHCRRRNSEVAALGAFLDTHVLEFAVFEDLAAFQAFHELSVLVAAYDLHARVLARWFLIYALRRRGQLGGHKSGSILKNRRRGRNSPEFPVF